MHSLSVTPLSEWSPVVSVLCCNESWLWAEDEEKKDKDAVSQTQRAEEWFSLTGLATVEEEENTVAPEWHRAIFAKLLQPPKLTCPVN